MIKQYLKKTILFIGVPLILLLLLYIWIDPFRIIKPFDVTKGPIVNREYYSTELFLRNDSLYHYNSFMFGSSRISAFNSYQWQQYLASNARVYQFQAWSETLTGIEQKLEFLNQRGNRIDNVIILLDIPHTFNLVQSPTAALDIKDYRLSHQSFFLYHFDMFKNFIKPSYVIKSIVNKIGPKSDVACVDTITNDYHSGHRDNYVKCPSPDSLSGYPLVDKIEFINTVKSLDTVPYCKQLINSSFEYKLLNIRSILTKHNTKYTVIVAPAYCYLNPKINSCDLNILYHIFGRDNVYDFSGKNMFSEDYNNFSDPNHFDDSVGWLIIDSIFKMK